MTVWVITALIVISVVLLALCVTLAVANRELRADLDLVTAHLVELLGRDDSAARLRPALAGPGL